VHHGQATAAAPPQPRFARTNNIGGHQGRTTPRDKEKKIQTNKEGTKLRGQEKNRGRRAGEAGGRDGETEPGEREKKQGLHREGEKGRGETQINLTTSSL